MLTLLLLQACLTRDSFPQDMAIRVCRRSEECAPEMFKDLWEDQRACVEDLTEFYALLDSDECTFDEEQARVCLAAIPMEECGGDGVVAECDGVYQCPDGEGE